MTQEHLRRCDEELRALVTSTPADIETLREVRIFNENVAAVRKSLLAPARTHFDSTGTVPPDLAIRLARAVEVLGPWKNTLLEAFGTSLGEAEGNGPVDGSE